MTRKKTVLVAFGVIAVLGASAVYAQDQAEQPPQAEAPAMQPETMPGGMMGDQQGMMGDQQGMMGDQQGMMPMMGMMGMMGMMAEMQEMMQTCNQMMKAMAPNNTAPESGEPSDRS